MAKKQIKLPTTQEIESLSKKGNVEQLRALNERLAKVANQRMAQFRRSHIRDTESLKRAKYWIEQESGLSTGGVFSRSKKLDQELLVEQLKQELIFLRAESSTVSGEKAIRFEKSFETLTQGKNGEKPYLEIPDNITVPDEYIGNEQQYFKDRFADFLSTDAWKDVKKYLYAVDDPSLLTEAGEAIARGAAISDLKDAYKKYLSNEIKSIHDMWDSWISIK